MYLAGLPLNRTRWQWQPSPHDPNPPLDLENQPVAYSLTCQTGSYTYSGQSASVTAQRNLTASAGSYTYAGNSISALWGPPSLTVDGVWASTVWGHYVWSYGVWREGPAGNTDYTLTCNAGSYTYTGQSVTVTAARNLTASAGSYTYTGQSATVTAGRNLTANVGSYTYTGQSATVKTARNLTAQAGSYTYAGQDATLTTTAATNYTLTCEAGSYTYSGQSVTLTASLAVAETQATVGGGSSRNRKKWPKRVMLRGRLYTVRNRDEELSLIQAALDRAQYQAAINPLPELEKPIPRLQRRLKKVESERDRWLKRLKQADEELILLLH